MSPSELADLLDADDHVHLSRRELSLLAAALRLAEAEHHYDTACRANDNDAAWPARDALDVALAAYRAARKETA